MKYDPCASDEFWCADIFEGVAERLVAHSSARNGAPQYICVVLHDVAEAHKNTAGLDHERLYRCIGLCSKLVQDRLNGHTTLLAWAMHNIGTFAVDTRDGEGKVMLAYRKRWVRHLAAELRKEKHYAPPPR
jgi:hypothetical protein